jgi:predicted transposase YbfD/YdcC
MDSSTEWVVVPQGELSACEVRTVYEVLKTIQDGRHKRGRRYEAAPVLTLMLLAKMAGENAWSGIAQWVRLRLNSLESVLPDACGPCANTYSNICEHIDSVELNAKLAALFAPSLETSESSCEAFCDTSCDSSTESEFAAQPLRHLACDGKEIRGTYRPTQSAQQVLGIYDVKSGCMQAMAPIDGKGHERAALTLWLRTHSVRGCVITADALHTQTALCRTIQRQGGEYLLIAKRNQRSLHDDIRFLFSQPPDFWFPERQARSTDSGHGRVEVRSIRVSDELNGYLSDRWPAVKQVFQIERRVERRGKPTTEVVCGITSLAANMATPEQLLSLVRHHWHIENRNHWRRDATLGEDRCTKASRPAAMVMAVLNTTILAIADRLCITNLRSAMRIFAANPQRALDLLLLPI